MLTNLTERKKERIHMELVEKYFGYDDGKGTAAEGNFRIGASQVSNFFDTTSQWYP